MIFSSDSLISNTGSGFDTLGERPVKEFVEGTCRYISRIYSYVKKFRTDLRKLGEVFSELTFLAGFRINLPAQFLLVYQSGG